MSGATGRRLIRAAGGAGVAALGALLAQPAVARVHVSPRLEIRETYSDNLNDGQSGFYTTFSPGVSIDFDSRRVQGGIIYDYERRVGNGVSLSDDSRHNLVARLGANVVNDLLRIDSGAVATRLLRDLRGQVTLNPDGDSRNYSSVYNVFITPTLTRHVGNFADLNLTYTASYTDVNNPDNAFGRNPNDLTNSSLGLGTVTSSVQNSATARLSSRPNSQRFIWSLTGLWQHDKSKFLNEVYRTYTGTADGEFVVTRGFSLLGSVGYEDLQDTRDQIQTDANGQPLLDADGNFVIDPTRRDISYARHGVIWDAGFRFAPNRHTSLVARGGRRYGSTTINANLYYKPNTRLTLSGSYNQSIDTFGRLLTQNVAGIPQTYFSTGGRTAGLSANFLGGVFPISAGQIGLFPLQSLLAINNATFRLRAGQLGIDYTLRKLNLGLGTTFQTRNVLSYIPLEGVPAALQPTNLGNRDRTISTYLSAGYKLGQRSNLSANLFYSNILYQLSQGRQDNVYGASLGLDHGLNKYVNVFLRGYASTRDSNVATGVDDDELSVTVGVRGSF